MKELNLPVCSLTFRDEGDSKMVFDIWRKKYVVLTPEEWVRQNFLHYLVSQLNYPSGLISVEKALKVDGLNFRTDAVVYNRKSHPVILIEFKAPSVELSNDSLFQLAKYNKKLGVPYLMLSNGLSHFCFKMDTTGNYKALDKIPEGDEIELEP